MPITPPSFRTRRISLSAQVGRPGVAGPRTRRPRRMSRQGMAAEVDVRHLKRDVREPAVAGELAPMRQGLLAEVNANGFAWRHRLGEVDGD